MTDPIEPPLTAEEWRYWLSDPDYIRSSIAIGCDAISFDLRQDPARLLALANAALPDDDPRKITLGTVVELQRWADFVAIGMKESGYKPEVVQANFDRMRAFADALASYLPPEVP